MKLSRRAMNAIRQLADGDVLYISTHSPRISRQTMREIEEAGLRLQEEAPRHEGRFVSPLFPEVFKDQARKLFASPAPSQPEEQR